MVEQVEKTTMPPATLSALRASIKHWQENVAAERPEDVKLGSDNCALCGLFQDEEMDEGDLCNGCPVYAKTGEKYCDDTPYFNVYNKKWKWINGATTRTTYQTAAQAELDFLISLLPEGETP